MDDFSPTLFLAVVYGNLNYSSKLWGIRVSASYSKYSSREESNLKKCEAEVNLFPENFISVQAYPVTLDPI